MERDVVGSSADATSASIDEKLAALGCFKTGSWTLGAERGQVAARPQMAQLDRTRVCPGTGHGQGAQKPGGFGTDGPQGPNLHEFRGRRDGAQPYPQPFEK